VRLQRLADVVRDLHVLRLEEVAHPQSFSTFSTPLSVSSAFARLLVDEVVALVALLLLVGGEAFRYG